MKNLDFDNKLSESNRSSPNKKVSQRDDVFEKVNIDEEIRKAPEDLIMNELENGNSEGIVPLDENNIEQENLPSARANERESIVDKGKVSLGGFDPNNQIND